MSYADAVGDAIKSGFCRYLDAQDDATRYFNELSPIDLPNIGKYWKPRLCNDDPDDIPTLPPPFEGGQCAVLYDVDVLFTASDNPISVPVVGPRMGTALGPWVSVNTNFTFRGTVNGNPNRYDYFIEAFNADGIRVSESGSNVPFSEGTIQLTRVDGQPDTCGNPDVPPPPPFPPGGDTFDIDVTYQDNDGDIVDIDGDVTIYAPIIAPIIPVTVYAPVTVDLGGVTFDGSLEFSPEFKFNFGTPPGDDSTGGGAPPSIPEPPDSDPDQPEDDSNVRLLGVVVRSQQSGRILQTEIAQVDGPTLYVPRIANVYFRVRSAGVSSWLGPYDVKTSNAWVPVPENTFAVGTAVDWESGWTGSASEIKGTGNP